MSNPLTHTPGDALRREAERPRTPDIVVPRELSELDRVLYEGFDAISFDVAADLRLTWIREAVDYCLARNATYATLAAQRGFAPSQMQRVEDLALVPTVTSGLFKRRTVRNAGHEDAQACTSSGTRGTKSIVWRDRRTLERFVGSVTHGIEEFFGRSEARRGFVIGPATEEAGDLWFSYVLSLVNLLFDTTFYVRSDAPRYGDLLRDLAGIGESESPFIIAPPSLLADFLRWMEREEKTLDLSGSDPLVITSGGWKKREAEAIDRQELERLVGDRLGVPEVNCRDFFNMVEINSVIFECEYKRKHIPPWLAVIPRNVADMSVQPYGEAGLLTFLDPTAVSYPGFVCSEDFGVVEKRDCECGRSGEVLRITRRLSGVEERGCGQKMNRYANQDRG